MGRKVILSLDPVIPDSLASWDRTIHMYIEMNSLAVAGQGLARRERRWPATAGDYGVGRLDGRVERAVDRVKPFVIRIKREIAKSVREWKRAFEFGGD
ncbi:hypothetical protein HOY80DRAFT_1050039 [Tuber brumale]|nr:hypothetical protein HOY80DRAFT_1050039 [Tuber brumale]